MWGNSGLVGEAAIGLSIAVSGSHLSILIAHHWLNSRGGRRDLSSQTSDRVFARDCEHKRWVEREE